LLLIEQAEQSLGATNSGDQSAVMVMSMMISTAVAAAGDPSLSFHAVLTAQQNATFDAVFTILAVLTSEIDDYKA